MSQMLSEGRKKLQKCWHFIGKVKEERRAGDISDRRSIRLEKK